MSSGSKSGFLTSLGMTSEDEGADRGNRTSESIVFYELTRMASQGVEESFDESVLIDEVA